MPVAQKSSFLENFSCTVQLKRFLLTFLCVDQNELITTPPPPKKKKNHCKIGSTCHWVRTRKEGMGRARCRSKSSLESCSEAMFLRTSRVLCVFSGLAHANCRLDASISLFCKDEKYHCHSRMFLIVKSAQSKLLA